MSHTNSPPYDPRVVANFLLEWGKANEVKITQLKLLKLYYYCYGWYLTEKKKPLAKNDFEAWKYGPVSRKLRKAFEKSKDKPISELATITDYYTGEKQIADPNFLSKTDQLFLEGILRIYGNISAVKLSDMTHEKDSPWDRVWNGKTKRARIGLRISDEDIESHFGLVDH